MRESLAYNPRRSIVSITLLELSLKMTWTLLVWIFHACNSFSFALAMESAMCNSQKCLVYSTAFRKVKLECIYCAVRLSNDFGHMSELQMSAVKLTMEIFSKDYEINLHT